MPSPLPSFIPSDYQMMMHFAQLESGGSHQQMAGAGRRSAEQTILLSFVGAGGLPSGSSSVDESLWYGLVCFWLGKSLFFMPLLLFYMPF